MLWNRAKKVAAMYLLWQVTEKHRLSLHIDNDELSQSEDRFHHEHPQFVPCERILHSNDRNSENVVIDEGSGEAMAEVSDLEWLFASNSLPSLTTVAQPQFDQVGQEHVDASETEPQTTNGKFLENGKCCQIITYRWVNFWKHSALGSCHSLEMLILTENALPLDDTCRKLETPVVSCAYWIFLCFGWTIEISNSGIVGRVNVMSALLNACTYVCMLLYVINGYQSHF